MPLTEDQQNEIEYNEQRDSGRRAHEISLEQRRIRLETIRLAKETLLESARSRPVDQREISPANIVSFAALLESHINE